MSTHLKKSALTRLSAAVILGLTAGHSYALPFATYEARSAGMGGTGVASSNIAGAPLFNPAMLAAQRFDDDFSFTLGVGVQALDKDGFIDDVEAFNDAVDVGNTTAANAAATRASGKTLDLIANAALNVGFSADKWAGAVSANGYVQANAGVTDLGVNSTADLVAFEISEVGVSIARKFGNLSIGVTPKSQSVSSYDASVLLRTTDDAGDLIDAATTTGKVDHGSNFNADIGVVYKFSDKSRWQAGVVVRNVSEQTYTTAQGKTVKIEPQSRAGIAYNGDVITLAVDYDLTENDPLVVTGDKSQMLAAGIEVDVLDTLKLRAGYATNTANVTGTDLDQLSAGVGLNILGAQFDLAVMGNDNSISAYAQFGVQF